MPLETTLGTAARRHRGAQPFSIMCGVALRRTTDHLLPAAHQLLGTLRQLLVCGLPADVIDEPADTSLLENKQHD